MDSRVKRFRTGARKLGEARRGRRYQALRQLAISYQREAGKKGQSVRSIASELGVGEATLERWSACDREREEVGLQEVVLTEGAISTRLTVVTPEGFRIEGLRAGEVAALLRVLR